MRLTNPMTSLSTTPRRLGAALLVLVVVALIATFTLQRASSVLSGTTANSNTYTASSCFQTVDIAVTNNNFMPQLTTIDPGCSVTWTQAGGGNHTTTNSTPSVGSLWDQNPIGGGGSYTYTFTTSGSYPYRCRVHVGAGMTGTITVR